MRIDAAAKRPVFGVLCQRVMPFRNISDNLPVFDTRLAHRKPTRLTKPIIMVDEACGGHVILLRCSYSTGLLVCMDAGHNLECGASSAGPGPTNLLGPELRGSVKTA